MTDKILITNDAGEQVEATAPAIISASRSTDIPAFYAKWFFNRLAIRFYRHLESPHIKAYL